MAGTMQLRKFQTTIYKDKSASDTAQIPATSATVKVYKQGATISSATTVAITNTAVAVYDVGRVLAGDNVQLGTTAASQMTVVSVDSNTQLTLRSTIGSGIAVSAGNRLVVYSAEASVYANSTATGSATSLPITLGSAGLLEFYTPEARFDYIVTNGSTLTLFIDGESGWAKDGVAYINVKNYSTFQAAINALPTTYGGVVHVPNQQYTTSTVPAVGAITLADYQCLIGEGGPRTAWVQYTNQNNNDFITINGDFSRVENLFLEGGGSGTGRGIVVGATSSVRLKNLQVESTPSWSLDITGSPNILTTITDCHFRLAATNGGGRVGNGAVSTIFNNVFFEPSAGNCLYLNGSPSVKMFGCAFQPNGTYDPASTDGDTGAFVYCATLTNDVLLSGCYFESGANNVTPNNWFIFLSGRVTSFRCRDSVFYRDGATTTSMRILKSKNTGGAGVFDLNLDSLMAWTSNVPVGTDDIKLEALDHAYIKGGGVFNAATGARYDLTYTGAVGTDLARDDMYKELTEITAPAAPATDHVRIYAVDNGGKTELLARFPTGTSVRLAIEP